MSAVDCGLEWCDSQGREEHTAHSGGQSNLKFVTDAAVYESDQQMPQVAMLWIEREDPGPTLLTLTHGGDNPRFATVKFTLDQVEQLAEDVLYWLALMHGVGVHVAADFAHIALAGFLGDAKREAAAQ